MDWKWLELRLNAENSSRICMPREPGMPLTSVHDDYLARITDSGGIMCKWSCKSRAALEETSNSVVSVADSYLLTGKCWSIYFVKKVDVWYFSAQRVDYMFCQRCMCFVCPKLILYLLFTGRNSHRLSSEATTKRHFLISRTTKRRKKRGFFRHFYG